MNSPTPSQKLPNVLQTAFEKSLQHFNERCPDYSPWLQKQLADKAFEQQLKTAWGCSAYVAEQCLRKPEEFKQLVEQQTLLTRYNSGVMAQRLREKLAGVASKEQLDTALRQFRNSEMLRIIWRDFNRLADMVETTADISHLADACIQQALDFHHQELVTIYGQPCCLVKGQPVPQQLLVLGMGKLGAYELNLSSDIDLIFCFPRSGETVGEKRAIDNHTFFSRLGQRLIQSLDAPTEDGFVFRVDMRLRPYGDSGPLVQSFAAMEQYYQDQGRDWERYAMIKARVVAGPTAQGEELMALLRPFTYRRYIDFTAIDALRSMKRMIQQELLRRQLAGDIKLGAGGIREIEFIVQSFQLIRGGRELELQERSLLRVLQCLMENEYLPALVVQELRAAYVFLRNTEHLIQGYQDKQSQQLPTDARPQAAMAYSMGFASWVDFEKSLQQHRDHVMHHFSAVISDAPEHLEQRSADLRWQGLWLDELSLEEMVLVLEQGGHEQATATAERLMRLRNSQQLARMQASGRERLDQFMPLLIQAVTEVESPSQALLRIFPFVEAVLRRTAYLVLLVENQGALKELVRLCAASPWISTQLARHPVLLDELLNASSLYHVPDKEELRDDLQQQVLRLPLNDLEAHMETLRYFRLAHALKVAACEVSERLPLMKVSDYLTWIAEVILEHVLAVAWHNLEERHGCPQQSEGVPCERRFIVVGYGKLGGIELGHGSDLDLVFIHDVPSQQLTNGERPIENSVFMTRLGQRMIHILTTQTQLGALYEADMRLRPSGDSGLLTTSLTAYKHYLQTDAWVWEHQALVRARVVAGSGELARDFAQVRQQVLAQARDEAVLKAEVVAMRQKMREHLLAKSAEKGDAPSVSDMTSGIFAIKQGWGGIVDIEFMVQYAVLAWSQQYPALATYTDNIRILESLQQEGLFSEPEVAALTEAYKVFRSLTHKLSLQEQKVEVDSATVAEHRQAVLQKWQQLFA
ncbi:bifunctional [glutamate--ammonia ligase]-adenylyl-L-tyrosine phosphorylase/[glutamate--ammonia-ligase] adenylyltransferase [Dasania sp. GY-MA-18]|uniref:Bifunctional glutamine synthetase adenylyltransferase/adenylyl-removing enzyme n=1 Tax=Dasania phycosphaerae TaxID=2950436 RepID=A0A9J6RK16_9GAMM|nr:MULTISPECIES: bifunctional [glutamate--ammonia ligase]-adenylyl-L-tyrosine phosphorylase/[glutamate--ammonia-ligase] adenylyltransferase [Dasania]MCR8922107.1 bifunctional [glutamate--ammonia ligase]-adenylyl-L-tyrosine phosphorylase/[glutamate--ammonia-ligase] adenylyltransferase [Dasania sp. GY-MA-18]MCZ0864535.1 bifunctional [glutamate--ammonia ligase]-adenylyl-L-tyrosine phosphorylase/[glutamate--ammonia-ligase] adenylyltransferase [Dasania phycosphaerae]MCZ0868263.1 bifunctional [glutama